MKQSIQIKLPKVSIIIPLYVIEDRFFEDLKKFEKLNYPSYEILIVCDKKVTINTKNARLVLTGETRTGPAEKRDLAISQAKGEICAFIDDDAYPHPNWLKNAIPLIKDDIVAVGGPGITPPEDNYWEQLTGLVYGSFFCGGFAQFRFVKGKRHMVVDYPAYNLLVKKDVLNAVGGYDSYFYGGEDTFLCLKIIKKGYKILYDPEVVVYHHRRPLFISYLKQIGNVGKHRGYFAKKFPETSSYPGYFLPSILFLGFFVMLALSLFSIQLLYLYLMVNISLWTIASLSVINKTNFINSGIVGIGIILTHLTYGYNFIIGLFTNKLER